jgi:hypothetical protein
MRFDLSTFALHHDAFFKRQYLAEPHPDLEFCLLSYKNLIASVWQADFQFGLGEVPGNNVFTVLNVAFGYEPMIELRLPHVILTAGAPHRCFHEIDRADFAVVYYNKVNLRAASPNARINTFWRTLVSDPQFTYGSRVAWQFDAGYFVKQLPFGLADPNKLNGNNPNIWEASGICRYAFYRRLSWIFVLRGESTLGQFDPAGGYYVPNGSTCYWKEGMGVEAHFIRGSRGGCLYAIYLLDDLPRSTNAPAFTLGNSRFSKNGLAQIGVTFFN